MPVLCGLKGCYPSGMAWAGWSETTCKNTNNDPIKWPSADEGIIEPNTRMMEFIPSNPLLEYRSETLQEVRKLYNLDQPGRMEEAITILEEWVKKQEHFVQKKFSREYLERLIIANKGLLERVKQKLDRTCLLRTLMPIFFGAYNTKNDFKELRVITDAFLPKLTPDNYRIYILKNVGKEFTNNFCLQYYRRLTMFWEYWLRHDYCTGIILVFDLREVNLMEAVRKLNITELYQIQTLFLEGYGTRIRGLHLITTSKLVDVLVSITKQVLTAKLSERISSHVDIETLYNFLPKDILPVEYGGQEQSLLELHGKWLDVLSSSDNMEYMKFVCASTTDQSRRLVDKSNEELLWTPGSFRTMVVD